MTESVKLTDYGSASLTPGLKKEEERVAALARRAQHGDYDEELIDEQLTRTRSFLGTDRFVHLRESFIVIVGLGGVGSHCASALARSGVSRIRLVDFDQVTLSSLNRHAVATLADVGTPKVECVRKRLQAVVPWVKWQCCKEVWRPERGDALLGGWESTQGEKPAYVVDAIDNIDSKVALLQYCHKRNINVVSSMGAGCKSDPTRIFVGDISTSVEDPLSKVTRRRLRAAGITEGIPVVYSIEKPGPGKAQLLPLPDDEVMKGKVNELSVLPDFRVRVLPVLGTMPAVFGYTVANFIVCEITGYPHEAGVGKDRAKMYDNILSALQSSEERVVKYGGKDSQGLKIPITKDDVGYLVEEVYRGKSVVSGLPTRLALIRWRPAEATPKIVENAQGQRSVKLDMNELVCMTKEEAAIHEREILIGRRSLEALYSEAILTLVNQRREEETHFQRYR